jgi:hypothetical protein
MPAPLITQVAKSTPFDNSTHNFNETDVQASLDYILNIFKNVIKEPTGFVNKFLDSTISFDNSTRTFSITPKTPTHTQYQYCINGKIYTETTTKTIIISNIEGLHYIWFDTNQSLQESTSVWDLSSSITPVSMIYWDSSNGIALRIGEERHGVILDKDTHKYLHKVEGPRIGLDPTHFVLGDYVLNGDGSLNSHAQYSITNGTIYDEDLFVDIINSATPTNNFEQKLSPIIYAPVFYLLGTDTWNMKTADSFPFYQNNPNPCYYNYNNMGTWSLANCTNTYYFATWLVLTTSIVEPVAVILGQRQDMDLISAINNNTKSGLILPRKFNDEMYLLKKLIWQTDTSYTNTPKARLVYIATTTEINPANDRYQALCNYNGNAGSGKYLDFFPGQSSDTSPFPIPESSYLRTLILTASANSTGTMSVYFSTDLVNPVASISLSNNKYARQDFALYLPQDTQLVTKILSGSINKPGALLWVQTSL